VQLHFEEICAVLAVGFALEGTLVRTPDLARPAFERLCAEVCENAGVVYDPEAAGRAYTRYGSIVSEGGKNLDEHIVQAVRSACAIDGEQRALAARYRQISGEVAQREAEPVKGAQNVLSRLRSLQVRLAILTNGMSVVERRKAEVAGFESEVIVSEDTGVEKPDPRAFTTLLELFGLPAQCVWYAGTDYDLDIAPALSAGAHAVWIAPQGARASGDSLHVIHDIEELLDLLKEPYTRGLLGLRYIAHTALKWRPGTFVPGEEYGLGK
jgi:FMN phosphatase YigB (HAD superfamily)